MKGDASTHTSNPAYRDGYERIYGNRSKKRAVRKDKHVGGKK